MRVSDEAKLVYVNPPRTASKFLWYSMHELYSDTFIPSAKLAGHESVWDEAWADYTVMMSVRSPFTRALSLYHRWTSKPEYRRKNVWEMMQQGKVSFEKLLHTDIPLLRGSWERVAMVHFEAPVPRVHYYIRQEVLLRDLKRVPQFGTKHHRHRLNVTEYRKPWYEYYTPRCVDKVLEVYAEDFARYGYMTDFDAAVKENWFS